MQCPACQSQVAAPHRDGHAGVVIRNRYLRVMPDGKILIACPKCGSELELPKAGRLVLHRRGKDSSRSSASDTNARSSAS